MDSEKSINNLIIYSTIFFLLFYIIIQNQFSWNV